MNVLTRYVSRDYLRNGKLNLKSGSYQSVSSFGSGGISGNYLPATSNADGTYTVDLSKVQFTGSIVAYGEVTAYGSAESGGSTTVGNVTIYDGLDSTDPAVALSANQGRILKELIGNGGGSIEKLSDVELVNLADGQILKYDAVKGHWVNGDGTKVTWENIEGKPEGLTDEKLQQIIDFKADDYLLKSVWDSVFTIDSSGNLRVKTNLVGEKGVSAYGEGNYSGGGGTGVTVYDGLDSIATDIALSANQGRVLKDLIANVDLSDYYTKDQVEDLVFSRTVEDLDLSDYYKKPEVNNLLTNYAKTTDLNNHTGDTTKHVTSTERTNWTNTNTNFNDWFYKDSNGNIHSKYSFIGDAEISAYGAGSSSGSGGVTIYDGLDSTSTDIALSANQGRYLKSLIDNIDIGNVDLSNYYTKTQVDDLIDDVDPSWSNISGKPTFATVATSGSYNDLSNKPTIPTNTNQLTNGAGFITSSDSRLSDSRPASDVYSWAKASSKPSYSWSEITSRPTSMPASDVYNWAKASSKPSYSWSEISSKPTFATVATSGKYSDLSGKPTIPTNNNQLTNGAGYITSSGSISGNAGSATKLATSRTLWGQSFNGSANVSGNMTGVGSISCTSVSASGEVTAHSDKRLKSNIKPLEVRGELNPVTYIKDGKESIGFIADEVKEVYPELVITDESTEEKYLSLNYQQLTAVLYAEIKELKNQIKELNEKVRTMAN